MLVIFFNFIFLIFCRRLVELSAYAL